MSKIQTAFMLLKNNKKGFLISLIEELCFLFPDRLYLRILYRLKLGRKLDLDNPRRFTEKLQWLKLYNRNPLYSKLVDKETAKEYVATIIGEKYLIPTLGVWSHFDDIDFDALPEQFVLKTTNGGGGSGVVICRDKKTLDKKNAQKIITRSLNQNIYQKLREWPYRNVSRRILAEQYLEDETGELRDYKFYCFNGEPKVVLVASNRFSSHNFNYYDMNFNPLPIVSVAGSPSIVEIKRPVAFSEMIDIAHKLSQNMAHVRVDLYSCQGKVYFGELTFFDSSGYDNMSSDVWDLKFGDWTDLSLCKNDYQ